MSRDLSDTALIPAWEDGTLRPVNKLDVHRRGLRHPAVSVFVVVRNEVLLQRRAAGKYHTPGLWANTCCTHPHWGEDPMICAARRLDEELGITGLTLSHRERVEYRADVGVGLTEHEVVDIYLAEPDERPAVTANPDEVMETRWITLADLRAEVHAEPHRFTPWLKIYLDSHEDRIFG